MAMGEPDVDAMLRRMSLSMLMEWMLFCPTVQRSDGAAPQEPRGKVKRQTPEQMRAVLETWKGQRVYGKGSR